MLKNSENSIRIIDELDEHGYGLVHYFSATNNLEALEMLMRAGANLNIEVQGKPKS